MNNRVMLYFGVAVLIIAVVVIVVLAIILHGRGGSAGPTATPTAATAGVTIHNDTSHAVKIQDCTAGLGPCASHNAGTTQLAAGASGTEHGATGIRILNLNGTVIGCISLSGAQPGTTVSVSSAQPCPAAS